MRAALLSRASERWEHGSDFHLLDYGSAVRTESPWKSAYTLSGSGRDSLRKLLRHGRRSCGWGKLWLPSYFCSDVTRAAKAEIPSVAIYDDWPEQSGPTEIKDATAGDIVLRVNYFGLRGPTTARGLQKQGLTVIEDHTHDPWSTWARASDADWCFASLRKTLPLPDGGILWSPVGHRLPDEDPVESTHETAATRKLAAMALKTLYLQGHAVPKQSFRALALLGERDIASERTSGIFSWSREQLGQFPIDDWRISKRDNYRIMCDALSELPGGRLLKPRTSDACPLAAVIVFHSPELRQHVRESLIAKRVYPAILWPLAMRDSAEISEDHLRFSRSMLSVHCDMRYDHDDTIRVAELILKAASMRSGSVRPTSLQQ